MNAEFPKSISHRNWSLKKSVTSFPNNTGSTTVLLVLLCLHLKGFRQDIARQIVV